MGINNLAENRLWSALPALRHQACHSSFRIDTDYKERA